MPSASARARSTATWSFTVTTGKRDPYGHAVGGPRARPGRALAASEHVRADDEVAVGVDGRRRGRRAGPTTRGSDGRARPGRSRASRRSRRAGPRTALEATRVELAPGLVGDRHLVEATARLELQGGLSRVPLAETARRSFAGRGRRPAARPR